MSTLQLEVRGQRLNLSYFLLVPPSLPQFGLQAAGCSRPLLGEAADPALHEAQRLFSTADLVKQHGEVGAEGSL